MNTNQDRQAVGQQGSILAYSGVNTAKKAGEVEIGLTLLPWPVRPGKMGSIDRVSPRHIPFVR